MARREIIIEQKSRADLSEGLEDLDSLKVLINQKMS
jgi:hypothetical protein